MHLPCPHCQDPFELADLPSGGEITCAGRGTSVQLDNFVTANWDVATNKRIGKFEILSTLGHRALGTVLQVPWDTEFDRTVAIKAPRACNFCPEPEDVDRETI